MVFAFLLDSVGFGEWFVLLAVVLVVVGPRNLPSTARKVGNGYSKLRRAAESFKRQLMEMDTEFDNAVSSAAHVAEDAFSYDDSGVHEGDGPVGEPHEGAPSDSAAGDSAQADAAQSAGEAGPAGEASAG